MTVTRPRTWLAALLLSLVLVSMLIAGGQPAAAAAPAGSGKPTSLIVRLKPGADAEDILPSLVPSGAEIDKRLGPSATIRVKVPAGLDSASVLAALRANPAVASAGADLQARLFVAPNDPGFPAQWDMQPAPAGINVESAWAQSPSRGAGVVVAVIDTGVAYESFSGGQSLFGPKTFNRAPDLANVPIVSPWDWIDGDAHAGDEHGHGTHVAGTILEGMNNGIAESGVSAASLMPLRILDFSGNGSASDLIDAIYYAADHGAQVINMSLGFSGTGSPDAQGQVCSEIVGLGAALDYAYAMGVTVVAASGNDGVGTVACPAAYPTVISVGATDNAGDVTYYSNGGTALDIAAPGGDPNTLQVTQQTYCLDPFLLYVTGQYNQFCDMPMSGTSMASPHVAGTVALLIGQHPTLSPDQVRDLLESTARDRGPAGWDSSYGAGILDAGAAMASVIANPPPLPPPGPTPVPRPAPVPGATNVSATAQSGTSIRLDWTDNATNETGFRIDRSTDGGLTWAQAATVNSPAVAWTNYGLTPATIYTYRVRSYDDYGGSPWSSAVSATTFPPPSMPTDVTAVALSSTSVRVSWTDTSTGEQGFRVEKSLDGTNFPNWMVASANATTLTVGQLTPSTQYWFRVRGYDGTILGEVSATVSVTTFALPTAPTNLVATGLSPTSIRLNWNDTSFNEQWFRVERSTDAGQTWVLGGLVVANTTTWTNNSLTPGTTYWFRVMGVDGTLNGPPSNVASAATLGAPSAPTNLTATAVNTTRIDLAWTDASTNEQGFKIERSTDGGATWAQLGSVGANATTFSSSGLTPATAYWFRVRAYDGLTNGDYSAVATASTMAPPSAPANIAGTPLTTTSLRLNWTNTSPIQTYVKIERSADGVTWSQVAFLTGTTTTFTNYALVSGTAYQFRLRAVEGSTNGPYSDVLIASTFGPPSAPVGLTATSLSSTSVKLTWTDTCSYETGFKVERSLDGVTWTQVGTLTANTATFSVFGLAAHTTYYFRVRAYEGSTNGDVSNVVTYATP